MTDAKKHTIRVQGCDDETVVTLVLKPDELEVIKRLVRATHAESECNCQPTICIDKEDVE